VTREKPRTKSDTAKPARTLRSPHGVHPEPETFTLFGRWKEVFDRLPVLTSPAYHAFRTWFRWEPMAFPTTVSPPTPRYRILDQLEGRDEDPCERMI